MAKTKTFKVADLKNKINHRLAHGDDSPEVRLELCGLLESILHDTGNYKGFNYVAWLEGGCDRWHRDGKPEHTSRYLGDETRRFYF